MKTNCKGNVKLKPPEPEFLTFDELAQKWGYSKIYLHYLIATGKIVPAIALSDQERYPGGEFCGGCFVGDIDESVHQSYSEYYVGTDIDAAHHPENWPQCAKTVLCHYPTDDDEGRYLFQFFSESPDPGNTKKWYYFAAGNQITGNDGKLRFRFLQSEIKRFEDENSIRDCSPTDEVTATNEISTQIASIVKEFAQDKEKSIIHRTTQERKHVLAAEIETARKRAADPDDVHSVWTELAKMAEAKEGCLIALGENEVKYGAGEDVKFFTKRSLRERMRRAKAR